jgi:lipoate-protein ligase A
MNKYIPNVTFDNNDILVNGEKVCGSMTRETDKVFVWATQISFRDYSEYIKKICQKPAIKKPAYIDSSLLTRDLLEKEIIAWLRKELIVR